MFKVYFQLGLNHIADLAAYDHILFIVALCAIYRMKEWRQVVVLITAFTIGHSITLILSALDIFSLRSDIIEFLIPLTIVLTALYNVLFIEDKNAINKSKLLKKVRVKYIIALLFGLIHGMGFSSYFKALLGKDASITHLLFPFNIGIEIGQLVIVSVMLLFAFLFMEVLKTSQRAWNLFISGAAFGIAFVMMIERWPF